MKSLLQALALGALLVAGTSTPALAQNTALRDYAMPHAVNSINGFLNDGLRLVSSSNFAQSAPLTFAGATQRFRSSRVHYSGRLVNGELADYRPHLMTLAYGGRWMRTDLRSGLAPQMSIVSTETGAAQSCDTFPLPRSLLNATTDALIYRIANGCPETGGVVRAINLADGPSGVPITLPLDRIELVPTFTAGGRLLHVFAYDGGARVLRRFTPDLTTHVVVASNVDQVTFYGQADNGTLLLTLNGELRRILLNGALSQGIVRRPAEGYEIFDVRTSGNDIYFLESYVTPTVPTFPPPEVPAIRARLFSATVDGSVRPAVLANLRSPGLLSGVTPTRVIYTTGGFDSVTFQSIPNDINSILRDGSGGYVRVHRVVSTATAFSSLTVNHVVGERVFFTTQRVDSEAPEPVAVQVAYVKTDTGTQLTVQGSGSAWIGAQGNLSGPVLGDDFDTTRVLLARRGINGGTAGAQLFNVVPETLDMTRLTILPSTDTVFFAVSFGAASLGSVFRTGANEAVNSDVFAFDLLNNRYQRLSESEATDEAPLF